MKNSLFFITIILGIMVSCTVESLQDTQETFDEQYLVLTAFSDSDDQFTRTIRQNDGSHWWSVADEISVFYARGDNGGSRFVSNNTEPQRVADFEGKIGVITGGSEISSSDSYFWALYPYDKNASCDGRSVTTALPSKQIATPGTFPDDVNIALARSKGLELSFFNVCGGFKFSVNKDNVIRARIRGNSGELLSGKIKVALGNSNDSRPEIESITDGNEELILEAPEGEYFQVGTPYLAVSLPSEFPNGFTIVFETPTEETEFVYNQPYTLNRSKFVTKLNMDDGLEYHLKHYATCTSDVDSVNAAGGQISVSVTANVDFQVRVPEEALSWLSITVPDDPRPEQFSIIVKPNQSINERTATITFLDSEEKEIGLFNILQKGKRVNGLIEINVEEPGYLDYVLDEGGYNLQTIKAMKINGVLNDVDFLTIYYDMPALTYIDLSEVRISKLPNKAFYKSTNVKKVILPNTLKTIGDYAFAESVIEEIHCPSVQSIGEYSFSQCIKLKSFNLDGGLLFPASLISIGKSAFDGCTGISTIQFDPGCLLESLTDNVFRNCNIKEIIIPSKVSSISLTALFETPLEKVDFEDGAVLTTMDRYFPLSLKWVKIPAKVTKITARAFSYTTGDAIPFKQHLSIDYDIPDDYPFYQLETVEFEEGSKLRTIGGGGTVGLLAHGSTSSTVGNLPYGAFAGCHNLRSITIPNSSNLVIEGGAFAYCTNLSSVYIQGKIKSINSFVPAGRIYLSATFNSSSGEITLNDSIINESIPAFFYCKSLTMISLNCVTLGKSAFKYCENLSTVEPCDVTTIGDEAFYSLKGLKRINLASTSSIGSKAFYSVRLNSVTFGSSLESIGDYAFYFGSMTTVDLSSCSLLETIGEGAFKYNTLLSNLIFPSTSTLKNINAEAFYNCTSLKEVSFPSSLQSIGSEAFYNCNSLKTVLFAENSSLKTIGSRAFYSCPIIRRFDARNCTQVTSIGSEAFASSDTMQAFYIGSTTAPTCYANTFGDVGNYSVLKVPDNSVSSYSSAVGWKKFASITGFNEGL